MILRTYAKINLLLAVGAKRSDGYHEVESFMQSIDIYDTLIVKRTDTGNIKISSNKSFIPCDERNLAYKAAAEFYRASGIECDGLSIHIKKYLPVGAGLGGGSSDASAVLHAMNILYNTNFSKDRLAALGAKIGADVAFFIHGGSQFAGGIGEKLSAAPPMPDASILIVKPPFSVSTPKAYASFDEYGEQVYPNISSMGEALEDNHIDGVCRALGNSLQSPVEKMHPMIADIRSYLLSSGAEGALMSGAGSAVFGIFKSDIDARRAGKALPARFGKYYVTKPIGKSYDIETE